MISWCAYTFWRCCPLHPLQSCTDRSTFKSGLSWPIWLSTHPVFIGEPAAFPRGTFSLSHPWRISIFPWAWLLSRSTALTFGDATLSSIAPVTYWWPATRRARTPSQLGRALMKWSSFKPINNEYKSNIIPIASSIGTVLNMNIHGLSVFVALKVVPDLVSNRIE